MPETVHKIDKKHGCIKHGKLVKSETPLIHATGIIYITIIAFILRAYRFLPTNATIRKTAWTYLLEGLILLLSSAFAVFMWQRVYVLFLKRPSNFPNTAYKALLIIGAASILAYQIVLRLTVH